MSVDAIPGQLAELTGFPSPTLHVRAEISSGKLTKQVTIEATLPETVLRDWSVDQLASLADALATTAAWEGSSPDANGAAPVPGCTPHGQLQPGEVYAGAVLDEAGRIGHHVVLMPARPSERLNWDDAIAWAQGVGGDLPSRREQSLLFANCKQHLEDRAHWSNERHAEEASWAWSCHFDDGYQGSSRRSAELSAVAVRRFNAQSFNPLLAPAGAGAAA